MDFESLSNNRFFMMLGGLLNLLLVNMLFILTTILSSGVLVIPAWIALFGVTVDIHADRDYGLFKRYVRYLIANIGYGLKLTLVLVPIGFVAYLNTQFIQIFAEQSDNTFLALMSFFVFVFMMILVVLTAFQMMLWRVHIRPMTFRMTFNYSFAIVMSSIKSLLAALFLLAVVVIVGVVFFPFSVLFGVMTFFSYGFVLIYEKRYQIVRQNLVTPTEPNDTSFGEVD